MTEVRWIVSELAKPLRKGVGAGDGLHVLLVDLIWQLLRRPIRMLGPDLFLDQVDHRLLSNCMVSILLLFASAAFPARDRWARQG